MIVHDPCPSIRKYISIVGEAPSPTSMPRIPLRGGKSGTRVQELLGYESLVQYLRAARTVNLLDAYPGKRWPATKAREEATSFMASGLVQTGDTVILLGKKVCAAFGLDMDFLETRSDGDVSFFLSPHPSGLNRWWNDPNNRSNAELAWKRVKERYA